MFYVTYVFKELRRRWGRTLLTVLGLALGVGMVASLTAVSNGLDEAQDGILSPLSSLGTDLLVTRSVGTENGSAENSQDSMVGPAGPLGNMSPEDREALMRENAAVMTDLAKLGKPGEKFTHDSFVPATQLTFPEQQAVTVTAIDGVSKVALGLTLTGIHQEGTIPEIIDEFKTGGETFEVNESIPEMTPEEEAAMRKCVEAKGGGGGEVEQAPGTAAPPPGRNRAFAECLPERLRKFRGSFTTPERTIRRNLGAPTTDLRSETYTIAGVDMTTPGLGLLTDSQLASGSLFSSGNATETVVAESYAKRRNIKVGGEIDLNGTKFKVVGLADPPLAGQAADIYLPLAQLQKLSGREGRVNVLLVQADDASDVSALESKIKSQFPGATVTSAKDVADQVSGSLVDAANLADRLGLVVALVMLGSAFLMAALLTLSSVGKRVRELGTLKAIGWRQWHVVRQVMAESLTQGVLGGLVGMAIGVGAAFLLTEFIPPLRAQAAVATPGPFALGGPAATASEVIHLQAELDPAILLLAMGLALIGGVLAGGFGAYRAARLGPADAMREIT